MIKRILVVMVGLALKSLVACSQEEQKSTADKVTEAMHDAVNTTKESTHDAGNAIKEAAHDAQNVVEEAVHDAKK